jgi:predicted PurR-regulated permease PerM
MKGEAMRVQWQVAFWCGTFLFLVLMLWLFSSVLLPFMAGLALGYLLDPVADRLERLGFGRLSATLVIMGGFMLAIVLLLVLVVPILGSQLAMFIEAFPSYVSKLQELVTQVSRQLSRDYGGFLTEKLGLEVPTPSDIRTSTTDLLGQGAQWLASLLKSVWTNGTALVGLMSLLIVTPVVGFYMLLDWDKLIATIDGLVPLRHRETVRLLARQIDAALAGFLRGQSLVCLFLGVWYGTGLSVIGLNFGLLIGISAGALSFIPYVGSLTALVLSSSVAIVQGWPSWHLLAMAIAVFVSGQFLEGNILSPKLVGDSVGLHPVWLIFALLAFGSLFGFTGLLVAVPLAAATGVVLRFAVQRYRESKLYTEVTRPDQILVEATKAPIQLDKRSGLILPGE